jgi:hypothetical protein
MYVANPGASKVQDALTMVLAGAVAALVVGVARGVQEGSPTRGLLSNPIPRRAASSPATRPTLDRAA